MGDPPKTGDQSAVALDETEPAVEIPEDAFGTAPPAPFWSSVLFYALELDPRDVGDTTFRTAGAIALIGAIGVLYLLGESWNAMSFAQLLAIVIGLGAGVLGTVDPLSRWPPLMLLPLAQTFAGVLALTLLFRVAGDLETSRAALAWSLCFHLAGLALTTRLWATILGQSHLGGEASRRRRLLTEARGPGTDNMLVKIVYVDGGASTVETTADDPPRRLKMATRLIGRAPRAGLIYLLSGVLVISRTQPSGGVSTWARHIVRVDEAHSLGTTGEVAEPAQTERLTRLAAWVLIAVSAASIGVAGVIALF